MKFPLVGSAVLVSLFLAFRLLPKHWVNTALTLYFVVLGTAALAATVLPFVEAAFGEAARKKKYTLARGVTVPYLVKVREREGEERRGGGSCEREGGDDGFVLFFDGAFPPLPPCFQDPTDLAFTAPEAASGALAAIFTAWYGATKHWLANNLLGLAFSVTGVEHLSLGAVSTGAILLGGLFVYDVFWVFCTPVMVTVAKSFDAPIKLLFPRTRAAARGVAAAAAGAAGAKPPPSPFSMLGLGDIVIPGVFVALLLRRDAARGSRRPGSPPAAAGAYFRPAFAGYVVGLAATIAVMNVFNAAQPALLYIVPAILGAVGAVAAARGEAKAVFEWSEEPEEQKKE